MGNENRCEGSIRIASSTFQCYYTLNGRCVYFASKQKAYSIFVSIFLCTNYLLLQVVYSQSLSIYKNLQELDCLL